MRASSKDSKPREFTFSDRLPRRCAQLGDKISSKEIAEQTGVPVTPWSGKVVEDEAQASAVAERLGFPLVVKASAGGGGRGIRVVDRAEDLAEAFRSAASEAAAAFGDDRLFIERKVTGGRHIEVQVAADLDGFALSLGCRDCSVQRRHQKVIEEAPPPGMDRKSIEELESAAVHIARKVGYSGVGTAEFLVSAEGFQFLEMNPRLQVEHRHHGDGDRVRPRRTPDPDRTGRIALASCAD